MDQNIKIFCVSTYLSWIDYFDKSQLVEVQMRFDLPVTKAYQNSPCNFHPAKFYWCDNVQKNNNRETKSIDSDQTACKELLVEYLFKM